MKRRRIEGGDGSITGGTGDVNPQFLTFTATQSGADTVTSTAQAIPIQRLPSGGRAQVLELLKAFVQMPDLVVSATATETTDSITLFLSTSNLGATATTMAEPRVFGACELRDRSAFSAGGTYFTEYTRFKVIDLTDGAGHGFLVATDNVYGQVVSVGTGAANSVIIKLYYRWKNVSLQEYIGIVQSQQ